MTATIKAILVLTLATCTAVSTIYADQDKAGKKDEPEKAEKAGTADVARSDEKKAPPGLMKKGGLPPGQIKKGKHSARPEKTEPLPADLVIESAPLSSVTTTSAPPVRVDPDYKRVESPRGTKVLPVASTNVPVQMEKRVDQ